MGHVTVSVSAGASPAWEGPGSPGPGKVQAGLITVYRAAVTALQAASPDPGTS